MPDRRNTMLYSWIRWGNIDVKETKTIGHVCILSRKGGGEEMFSPVVFEQKAFQAPDMSHLLKAL